MGYHTANANHFPAPGDDWIRALVEPHLDTGAEQGGLATDSCEDDEAAASSPLNVCCGFFSCGFVSREDQRSVPPLSARWNAMALRQNFPV
jgi:hypothetical protein